MRRVKRRIFSGCVCEQIVFNTADADTGWKKAKPARPRFASDEERAAHRLGISRRRHQRIVNANFTPSSLYSTLTLSNEYEVHTFEEARRVRDNYVRRLRSRWPDAKIMIYMGRGKNTSRIHFHMLSDGIPEDGIIEKWGMGEIARVEHLRGHIHYDGVDHGQDYTGLADYLFDHWTPEQGGHRWKQTRNLAKPQAEDATEVKREYSAARPPRAPKGYTYIGGWGTRYGLLYFKYVRTPEKTKPTTKGAKGGRPPDGGENPR